MLLGRAHERQRIEQALASARSGTSAMLGYAGERAAGMTLLQARAIESEAQIPFGSLLELIRPALFLMDKIPGPQAAALKAHWHCGQRQPKTGSRLALQRAGTPARSWPKRAQELRPVPAPGRARQLPARAGRADCRPSRRAAAWPPPGPAQAGAWRLIAGQAAD